jgi:hypothetical protein
MCPASLNRITACKTFVRSPSTQAGWQAGRQAGWMARVGKADDPRRRQKKKTRSGRAKQTISRLKPDNVYFDRGSKFPNLPCPIYSRLLPGRPRTLRMNNSTDLNIGKTFLFFFSSQTHCADLSGFYSLMFSTAKILFVAVALLAIAALVSTYGSYQDHLCVSSYAVDCCHTVGWKSKKHCEIAP